MKDHGPGRLPCWRGAHIGSPDGYTQESNKLARRREKARDEGTGIHSYHCSRKCCAVLSPAGSLGQVIGRRCRDCLTVGPAWLFLWPEGHHRRWEVRSPRDGRGGRWDLSLGRAVPNKCQGSLARAGAVNWGSPLTPPPFPRENKGLGSLTGSRTQWGWKGAGDLAGGPLGRRGGGPEALEEGKHAGQAHSGAGRAGAPFPSCDPRAWGGARAEG